MSTWITLILVGLFIVGCIIYNRQKTDKLVSEGKIIKRDASFVETGEEFTLKAVDKEAVTRAIKAMPYADMKVSMNGDTAQQVFNFSGGTFGAQVSRKEADADKSIYIFRFTRWKENHNGGIYGIYEMNMLVTAVEKAFLSLDPNTQVKTWKLETKSKPNFF